MTVSRVLQDVVGFIENDNWMDCGDYLVFGWKEYLEDTGSTEALDMIRDKEGGKTETGGIGWAVWNLKQTCLPQEVVDGSSLHKIVRLLRDKGGEEVAEVGIAFGLIMSMPAIVKRSQLLDLMVAEAPIKKVAPYLREATACYMFGLNVACVMICRSALERALEQRLPTAIPHFASLTQPSDKGHLEWLIDLGGKCSLFRDKGADFTSEAHKFRQFSNDVVHNGQVPNEMQTREHLEMLRALTSMIMRRPKGAT